MDFESYKARISALDMQIDSVKKQIQQIENQIEEAHAAKISANKMRNEFDGFVARRKASADRPVKGRHLKSFRSFFNKAQSILGGTDYFRATASIDEMCNLVNQKIYHYEENLDYCKNELRRLNKQKELLVEEYNTALLTYTLEGGTP